MNFEENSKQSFVAKCRVRKISSYLGELGKSDDRISIQYNPVLVSEVGKLASTD